MIRQLFPALRIHLRGVRYGHRLRDKILIMVLIGLHFLIPLATVLRRYGLKMGNPTRFMPSYHLKNATGIFEAPGSGGAFGAFYLYCTDDQSAVLSIVDTLQNGVFIDVGASIGYFSVRAAKRLAGRGSVVAIEPHPQRYCALRTNIRLNGLHNIVCHQCAAGAIETKATLYELDFGMSLRDVSLLYPQEAGLNVDVHSIDTICAENNVDAVALIKIDVEGFEGQVLLGMSDVMRRFHPEIVFEALTSECLKECKEILTRFDYDVHALDATNFLATYALSTKLETVVRLDS